VADRNRDLEVEMERTDWADQRRRVARSGTWLALALCATNADTQIERELALDLVDAIAATGTPDAYADVHRRERREAMLAPSLAARG
jgi:hypothetical protein